MLAIGFFYHVIQHFTSGTLFCLAFPPCVNGNLQRSLGGLHNCLKNLAAVWLIRFSAKTKRALITRF